MTLKETMKPRERVLAALAGEPVDRPAVINPGSIMTVELMDLTEARFPDACRDPELNARLAATGFTEMGFDSTYHHYTIVQESSALGCKIQWEQKDNWPTVVMSEPIWDHPDQIAIPPGFLEHPDTLCVTRATEILKREVGGEACIIGKTMGPWSLGYHTFGVQNFLLMSIDDPDLTMTALHKLKEVSVMFGEAQIAAGADVLMFPDHATGDLVSGDYYRRFLMELHQEMAERLSVPLILHICGYTLDRMQYLANSGMDCFHFDSKNDPQKAMDLAGGKIRLVGNVNNPITLFSKDTEAVRAEVDACLDAGVDLIAPECAIPLQTKLENVLEIPRAVQDWAERNPNSVYTRARNGGSSSPTRANGA